MVGPYLETINKMSESSNAQQDAAVLKNKAQPLGAYPHFKRAGPFVFISGTSSRRNDNTIVGAETDEAGAVQLDIRAQTDACISNVRDVLRSAGGDLENLVDVSTFLINMDDFAGYNEVYNNYFSSDGPARTTVAVHQLPHPQLLIEIKATAYIP